MRLIKKEHDKGKRKSFTLLNDYIECQFWIKTALKSIKEFLCTHTSFKLSAK
jgi:hypothetical protein